MLVVDYQDGRLWLVAKDKEGPDRIRVLTELGAKQALGISVSQVRQCPESAQRAESVPCRVGRTWRVWPSGGSRRCTIGRPRRRPPSAEASTGRGAGRARAVGLGRRPGRWARSPSLRPPRRPLPSLPPRRPPGSLASPRSLATLPSHPSANERVTLDLPTLSDRSPPYVSSEDFSPI